MGDPADKASHGGGTATLRPWGPGATSWCKWGLECGIERSDGLGDGCVGAELTLTTAVLLEEE